MSGIILKSGPVVPTEMPCRAEFLRLPRTGARCPLTGLSRSMMNALILPTEENNHRPPVRSVVLRRPGNIRGVRLVDAASLLTYLRSHADPQSPEPATP